MLASTHSSGHGKFNSSVSLNFTCTVFDWFQGRRVWHWFLWILYNLCPRYHPKPRHHISLLTLLPPFLKKTWFQDSQHYWASQLKKLFYWIPRSPMVEESRSPMKMSFGVKLCLLKASAKARFAILLSTTFFYFRIQVPFGGKWRCSHFHDFFIGINVFRTY